MKNLEAQNAVKKGPRTTDYETAGPGEAGRGEGRREAANTERRTPNVERRTSNEGKEQRAKGEGQRQSAFAQGYDATRRAKGVRLPALLTDNEITDTR